MGRLFFKNIGFKELKTVEILGYEAHPKPIYAWLGLLDQASSEPVERLRR